MAQKVSTTDVHKVCMYVCTYVHTCKCQKQSQLSLQSRQEVASTDIREEPWRRTRRGEASKISGYIVPWQKAIGAGCKLLGCCPAQREPHTYDREGSDDGN